MDLLGVRGEGRRPVRLQQPAAGAEARARRHTVSGTRWTAYAPLDRLRPDGPLTPRWTAVTSGYGGPTGEQGSNGRTGVQRGHRGPTGERRSNRQAQRPRTSKRAAPFVARSWRPRRAYPRRVPAHVYYSGSDVGPRRAPGSNISRRERPSRRLALSGPASQHPVLHVAAVGSPQPGRQVSQRPSDSIGRCFSMATARILPRGRRAMWTTMISPVFSHGSWSGTERRSLPGA